MKHVLSVSELKYFSQMFFQPTERTWNEMLSLPALPTFKDFLKNFKKHIAVYREIFDATDPHLYVKFSYNINF